MIATINLIVLRHLDADGPRMMVIIFITGHIKQESLSLFDTKAQSNTPTLLYSPWEKIDVKSHSKVRNCLLKVHKCVSIL